MDYSKRQLRINTIPNTNLPNKPSYHTAYEQFISHLTPNTQVYTQQSTTQTCDDNNVAKPREIQSKKENETTPKSKQSDTKHTPRTTSRKSVQKQHNEQVDNKNVSETMPYNQHTPIPTPAVERKDFTEAIHSVSVMAYECTMCLFETIYEDTFKEHMLTHKKLKKKTFHKCPKCDFTIKCRGKFRKHMVLEETEGEEYCGRTSYVRKCQEVIDLHLRAHNKLYLNQLKSNYKQ